MGIFDFFRGTTDGQIERQNEPKDARKSECPNCHAPLKKVPGSKTKCPHCGQFMFVRTRPQDNVRVVVGKEDADKIDEDWSIIAGTHDVLEQNKKEFAAEKEVLKKRFGKEPSDHDVAWSILNKQALEHMKNSDWGLYRNVKFQMGEILRKEMRLKEALDLYCEVCYFDLNGANNAGGRDPEILKEFPPFDPTLAFLAPGIVDLIRRLMKKMGMSIEDLKERFLDYNARLKKGLPLSPEECWQTISKEL